MVPQSFNYFRRPAGTEPAKYHACDFRLDRIHPNRRTVRWPGVWRVGRTKLGVFEHLAVRLPLLRPILCAQNELEALLVVEAQTARS